MKHSTRFESYGQYLVYGRLDKKTWSFFIDDGDGSYHQTGPHYRTKDNLLADMTRFAEEWGF